MSPAGGPGALRERHPHARGRVLRLRRRADLRRLRHHRAKRRRKHATHTTANACLAPGARAREPAEPSRRAPPVSRRLRAGAMQHCRHHGPLRARIARARRGRHHRVGRPAPTQPGPFQNVVTVSAKERGSDSPSEDPNQDTITLSEGATALVPGGPRAISFVPKGIATRSWRGLRARAGNRRFPRSTTPSSRSLPSRTIRRSFARRTRSAVAAAG